MAVKNLESLVLCGVAVLDCQKRIGSNPAMDRTPALSFHQRRTSQAVPVGYPIALHCRDQPARGVLPPGTFPRFTLSPMPQNHRFRFHRSRAEEDVLATSVSPGPGLSPTRKLPREKRGLPRNHEERLRESAPGRFGQLVPGWIVSVDGSPRSTRTTSCPLVSMASTPPPKPAGRSTSRSYPP